MDNTILSNNAKKLNFSFDKIKNSSKSIVSSPSSPSIAVVSEVENISNIAKNSVNNIVNNDIPDSESITNINFFSIVKFGLIIIGIIILAINLYHIFIHESTFLKKIIPKSINKYIPKSIFPMPTNISILNKTLDKRANKKGENDGKYCYIGRENKNRVCVELTNNQQCSSQQIFLTKDLCLRPN